MKSIVAFELLRAFRNKMFVIALAIGCVITLAHVFITVLPELLGQNEVRELYGAKGGYPLSLFYSWIGGVGGTLEINLYFLLLPLLICIPHADTFLGDRNSSYLRNIAQRSEMKKYYAAKIISIFLSAACVAVIPLILNLIIVAMLIPAYQPIPAAGMFAISELSMLDTLFYQEPFAYLCLFLTLIFMFSGLLSLLVIPFSYLISNRVLVMLSPFALCAFLDFLLCLGQPDLATFSPLRILRPDQIIPLDPFSVTTEFVILLAAILCFSVYRAHKDEVY